MRLIEKDHEIDVTDSPGAHWLLGLLFVGVGAVFVFGGFFARDAAAHASWERALFVVMGGLAAGAGLWVIHRAPQSRLHVNSRLDRIRIVRRGLGGRRSLERRASDVAGVRLVERTDDEGGAIFQVHLMFRDRAAIPVSELWVHGREEATELAARLGRVLGVPGGDRETAG